MSNDRIAALPPHRNGDRLRLILFDLGDTLASGERLRPGALATLRGIHGLGNGLHLALLSDVQTPTMPDDESRIRREYESLLGRLGIRSFFEPTARWVTLSSEVGANKPDPATFHGAMRKAGADVTLADVLFITENADHVREARELGMRAVRVPVPGSPTGDADVDDLPELIGLVERFLDDGHVPDGGPSVRVAVTAATTDGASPTDHRVQLGDLSVLIGPASGEARSPARPLDRLHLVVQNGRTFQQEHPEVPVLADKGRYLVVDIDPATARASIHPEQACFAVVPLPLDSTVFSRATLVPAAPEPWVRELVDRVTAGRFRVELDKLVAYGTRYSTSSAYRAAATAVGDELAAQGYAVALTPITVRGRPSWNVVAERPGSGPDPRPVVLVTAHLDSINLAGGPAALAPGADDNGSGSAGLLTIARIFAGHRGTADLRLILFGGEEQGLFGSRQYVAGLDPSERDRIVAVVNMDMIGSPNTPAPTVLIEGGEVSRPVMDELATAAATYTTLIVQTSLTPFNSDHVPFIDAGIPAVLTIEGADGANDRVHTDQDLAKYVDDELAGQILRMNVAFLAGRLGRIDQEPDC
ncbi:MAG TPA: M28 family peptidase [Nakamurella sp.]